MARTGIEGLETIATMIALDEGLRAAISKAELDGGIYAASVMSGIIGEVIERLGLDGDDLLTPQDLRHLVEALVGMPKLRARFLDAHGDDMANWETGFHLVQGEGGTLLFQGRDYVDTVADAIFHVVFPTIGGRFVNEDGNENERVVDVAGWLNYFLNGRTVVFGTEGSDTLGSGDYSAAIADAADELFLMGGGGDTAWGGAGADEMLAGGGNDLAGGGDGGDRMVGAGGADRLMGDGGADRIFGGAGIDVLSGGDGGDRLVGGQGNDTLWGGAGVDRIEGGAGSDRLGGDAGRDELFGGSGRDLIGGGEDADRLRGQGGGDTLWGDEGADRLLGGGGADLLEGGDGADRLSGGLGNDRLTGGDGDDSLSGGAGDDSLTGSDGADLLVGGEGADRLSGGEGADRIVGGRGADVLLGWEDAQGRDVFVFAPGDSGATAGTRDVVEGFSAGTDRIDLTAFGGLDWIAGGIFVPGGGGQVRYDGERLQIDADGDTRADMEIELRWVSSLGEADLLL